MELRDYFKIIGKNLTLFWVVVVLCLVATIGFTELAPTTYTASTTLTINKSSAQKQINTDYYLFDNYYNVQSAGLYSQIVGTWFSSPSLVKTIYENAGIAVPNVSQSSLAKTFKAVREEPSTINVSIVGKNRDELEKLISSATTVIQTETDKLGKNSESFYEIAKFNPIVNENIPNVYLNTLIGLVLGLAVGAMLVFGINYFKAGKES